MATAFVIRASDFPRHSTFGFRHFAACQSYDGKVAGARADFQMEMFPCRCMLAQQDYGHNQRRGASRPAQLALRDQAIRSVAQNIAGRLGGAGKRPYPFAVILRFAAVEIYRDQRPKIARGPFPFDVETATDSRLLALRCFCRAHRDDRSRYRSTRRAHGRSARRNREGAEKISRRDGWRRGEWTTGGASARLGSAASVPRAGNFYDERGAHGNRHLPNGRIQPR